MDTILKLQHNPGKLFMTAMCSVLIQHSDRLLPEPVVATLVECMRQYKHVPNKAFLQTLEDQASSCRRSTCISLGMSACLLHYSAASCLPVMATASILCVLL